jgi:hypothetical protein
MPRSDASTSAELLRLIEAIFDYSVTVGYRGVTRLSAMLDDVFQWDVGIRVSWSPSARRDYVVFEMKLLLWLPAWSTPREP